MIKFAAIVVLLAPGAYGPDVKLGDTAKNDTGGAAGTGADAHTVTPADASCDEPTDPNGPLAERSIYFDFDSHPAKLECQGLLGQHSHYLQSHNQHRVLIRGNVDERGTGEYNLALGQERAEAVYRVLSSMGVPDSQMEAVSLGKEKLQATSHDEDSWAQNRRADTVY